MDIIPMRTLASNGEEMQSSSTKSGHTRGATVTFNLGLQSQAAMITGTTSKTKEETVGSERKHFVFKITEHHGKGNIGWGISVNDVNLQEGGIDLKQWGMDMGRDILPTARFKFHGNSLVPAPPGPPPNCMDIVITSYWSIILPSEPKSTWIHKLLHFFKSRSTGNTQTTSFSNLFQIVALTADLSKLREPSHYIANVEVRPQVEASDPQAHVVIDKLMAADSVHVTPIVVDGMYITLLTYLLESDETNIFRSAEAKQLQSPSNGKV